MELAAGALGAVGSVVSGISANAQASRAAAIDEQNAKIAQDQAAADAASIRNKAIRLQGSQRAQAGTSGIDLSGFIDAINDSSIENEMDAQTAEYNGRLRARGFRDQADASRASGKADLVGGIFGAGTKALSAYGAWKQPDPYGVS